MNMEAGHGGSAARFERLRERTHDFAFALKIFGLTEAVPVSHRNPTEATGATSN
jgi:oligopeptidase B